MCDLPPESDKKTTSKKGYESLSRDTIQGIRNGDALALWTWGMSQSHGWVMRESHIRKELSFGQVRYRKARQWLTKLGLWEVVRKRNEAGKIISSHIQLHGEINTALLENSHAGQPHNTKEFTPPISSQPLKVQSIKEPEVSAVEQIFKKNKIKNKTKIKNKPAAGGFTPKWGRSNNSKKTLTFADQFGIVLPTLLNHYVDEARAVKIAMKYGQIDTGTMRKILAELTAMLIRNDMNDIYAAWVKLLRTRDQVVLSKIGEENLPPFA